MWLFSIEHVTTDVLDIYLCSLCEVESHKLLCRFVCCQYVWSMDHYPCPSGRAVEVLFIQWWRNVLLLFPQEFMTTDHQLNNLAVIRWKRDWSLLDLMSCFVDLWLSSSSVCWVRCHSGIVVAKPFCVEFACSTWACMGFLLVLRLPPTHQRHAVSLIVDSKWSSRNGSVSVSMHQPCDWLATSPGWATLLG